MTMKMYQTPIVDIAKCTPFHILMVSEPEALEDPGTTGYAPERRDVF